MSNTRKSRLLDDLSALLGLASVARIVSTRGAALYVSCDIELDTNSYQQDAGSKVATSEFVLRTSLSSQPPPPDRCCVLMGWYLLRPTSGDYVDSWKTNPATLPMGFVKKKMVYVWGDRRCGRRSFHHFHRSEQNCHLSDYVFWIDVDQLSTLSS